MEIELTDVDLELFASMLVLTQQLMARVEDFLKPLGLTARQWLLLAVVDKGFPGRAPTLAEATAMFGTSRQNVKQVALQLERGGWLRLEPDPVDRRAKRLVLTDRLAVFDDPTLQQSQAAFILDIFGRLSARQRTTFLHLVRECLATEASRSDDPSANAEERS